MELGGKNPMIVLDDVDPGRAAEIAVRACFDNAGQLCVGIERIYVLAGAYDAFMERFIARIGALRMHASVGWGTDYGSLISAEQLARITAAVDDAVAKGATVLTGGHPLPEIGPFFYAPTVLTGVTEDMTCFGAETFGPVVAVQRVESEQEAISLANDSPYGLNASVLTEDDDRGARIARQLGTGSVNVNEAYEATFGSTRAPMGGRGLSGLGRRNGDHGLTRFTEEQTIAIQRGIGLGTPVRDGARRLGRHRHPRVQGPEGRGIQVGAQGFTSLRPARWGGPLRSGISSKPWATSTAPRAADPRPPPPTTTSW